MLIFQMLFWYVVDPIFIPIILLSVGTALAKWNRQLNRRLLVLISPIFPPFIHASTDNAGLRETPVLALFVLRFG